MLTGRGSSERGADSQFVVKDIEDGVFLAALTIKYALATCLLERLHLGRETLTETEETNDGKKAFQARADHSYAARGGE